MSRDDDDRDERDQREEAGPRKPRYLLHAGLFLATFLTTTMTGAIYVHKGLSIGPMADGLTYSLPLMLILLCHELGHYVVARRYGVDASLPYFIPFPLGLGTLGAVIGMRQSTTDRKQLIDVGAAGPLAGLIVAIPFLIVGLMRSQVGPIVGAGEQTVTMEGNSILYALAKFFVKGAWMPGGGIDVHLHPMAMAAWAGLFVTMINLLPIGQLDGGHIATAYFGNRYNAFAERLRRLLPVGALAAFLWVLYVGKQEAGAAWRFGPGASIAMAAATPWLVWFLLIGLMRRLTGGVNHPQVDDQPLAPSRRALFWLMVIVFVAVFMPVPFREVMAGQP
ncbi:MAG TPA: site-2 protease family protein [Polyangia bacterium]